MDTTLPGYHETNSYPGQPFVTPWARLLNVDKQGEPWAAFHVDGEFKSREFYHINYLCLNTPYATETWLQPALAAGSFGGIRYKYTDFNTPDVNGNSLPDLWNALAAVGEQRVREDPEPLKFSRPVGNDFGAFDASVGGGVYDRDPATLLTFNDVGGCLALWKNNLMISNSDNLNALTLREGTVSAAEMVALGDAGLVLTATGFVAPRKPPLSAGYDRITAPYDRQWVPAGPIYWVGFDEDSLTAVGTQFITATQEWQAVILKNGAALPLSDLCPGRPWIAFSPAPQRAQVINKKGMIVAVVNTENGPAISLLVPFGLTVDADNNNGDEPPDRTYEEVYGSLQRTEEHPGKLKHSLGKIIDVTAQLQSAEMESPASGVAAKFVRVVLQLPKLAAWEKLTVHFKYEPCWRLWTKDESGLMTSVNSGGDLLPSDEDILCSKLGPIADDGSLTAYLECVGVPSDASPSKLGVSIVAIDGHTIEPVKSAAFVYPFEIVFEPVGNNWPIENNTTPDGVWMPGRGKKIFVDAMNQSERSYRDTVFVKAKGAPAGQKIILKVFDVDDPTPHELEKIFAKYKTHVIDKNDTDLIKRGEDNTVVDNRVPSDDNHVSDVNGQPYFVSTHEVTVICTVDSSGTARLGDGKIPKLKLSRSPGDNFRVAAAFLDDNSNPIPDQDMDALQVTDSTHANYVSPDSARIAGFHGAMSPMLTVWRKLNLEMDSMNAVKDNFEKGAVYNIAAGVKPGRTDVTLDILLTGSQDSYENGILTVDGVDYKVEANTDYLTNFISGDVVTVIGAVPSTAKNHPFVIKDDDDAYLAEVGVPAPLPRDQDHAAVISALRPGFARAYIQLEDANSHTINPNPRIPFSGHVSPIGSAIGTNQDVDNTEYFWAFTVVFAYEGIDTIWYMAMDGDPDSELLGHGLLQGAGSKSGGVHRGVCGIFVETCREATFNGVTQTTLNNRSGKEALKRSYYDNIVAVIAHEIAHGPGGHGAGADHDEGGLMEVIGASEAFTPLTIKRLREAASWRY